MAYEDLGFEATDRKSPRIAYDFKTAFAYLLEQYNGAMYLT
ncbi:MAG: hypothetical protein OIF50_11520 [Flavobacteriaceae bacterium]|nr:hypothetical protein [Flavobacteriaceae bacterium]